MKIEASKKANSVIVINDGVKKELKIRNLAPDHSFPRYCIVDIGTGKVEAWLSNGGSYGWIINCDEENENNRWLLLKAAKEAKRANLYWPWNIIQC